MGLFQAILQIVIVGAVVLWLLGSGSDRESGLSDSAREDWSAHVKSTAHDLAVAFFDGEPQEVSVLCRDLVRLVGEKEYVTGAHFPNKNWDGSIGARAEIARNAIRTRGEDAFVVFGVRDSFSGTERVIEMAKCQNYKTKVVVKFCKIERTFCSSQSVSFSLSE